MTEVKFIKLFNNKWPYTIYNKSHIIEEIIYLISKYLNIIYYLTL